MSNLGITPVGDKLKENWLRLFIFAMKTDNYTTEKEWDGVSWSF